MDAGPLVARRCRAVRPDKSYQWHKQQLVTMGVELAGEVFDTLAAGELPGVSSWDVSASHWYPREPGELLRALYSAPSLAHFYASTAPAGPTA